MGKSRSLPLANYPSGSRNFGPWTFPNGLDGFDIRIGRCTTADPTIWSNPATIITLDLQFSFDGGATFSEVGANSWEQGGGIITQRGVEVPESVVSWRFSPDEPTHAKARITVQNGPVRTYLDLTVL